MTQATSDNITTTMRILKVASCPAASGKTTLTYHIGGSAKNNICFRIIGNTGGGYFSAEWVSFSAIQSALAQAPIPLTSYPLFTLYQGKSINTPAFLMAALKHEGLVRNLEGNVRGYEILDSKAFMTEMNALIASGVNLKVAEIPANYKTSIAIKQPALTNKSKKVKSPIEASIVS
jgi:hypothetical protein